MIEPCEFVRKMGRWQVAQILSSLSPRVRLSFVCVFLIVFEFFFSKLVTTLASEIHSGFLWLRYFAV